MTTHLKSDTVTKLVLDNCPKDGNTTPNLVLNIGHPKDPDSWRLMYNEFQLELIETILHDPIDILIKLEDKYNDLQFAPAGSVEKRQVFDGLLFVTGNRTIDYQDAVATKLVEPYLLQIQVRPSVFWRHPDGKYGPHDGNKVGFRFVVQDPNGQIYFSHDPVLVGRDWDEP